MAKETALEIWVGGGEDHEFVFDVTNVPETVAIDITGWALSFMVKRRVSDADSAALVTKTTSSGIAIAGVFAAVITTNTQRATVTIADSDVDDFVAGLMRWELKRTGAGVEAPLAYGPINFRRSVHKS